MIRRFRFENMCTRFSVVPEGQKIVVDPIVKQGLYQKQTELTLQLCLLLITVCRQKRFLDRQNDIAA